jgi:hypothetical protein
MSRLKYSREGKIINVVGSYRDLLLDIEDKRKDSFKHNFNKERFERYTTNNDKLHSSFAGGTWDDVTSLKNMDSFKKTLAEFQKNKLEEKVKARIDFSPKRKRSLSEHDGDWDFDKQWDIKPFSNSQKEMLPINVVDINVDMSISANMDAEAINKYGALVWSVIQIIESIGIQANIYVINECTGISNKSDDRIQLCIKKAGEYISPISLATCFQSVFFRRAIFTGIVFAAEHYNEEVYGSLGSPKVAKTDKYILFEKGSIFTRPGGSFSAKEVEESVLQMLGKGK